MSNTGNSAKGNPASKRMSNANLKARRARSWSRGQSRKLARRRLEEEAHRRNVAAGITPWEQATAARRQRRHAAA